MISVGIISRDEETAARLEQILGKVMSQRGRRMHLSVYENSYEFSAEWRGRGRDFDILFWDLSFLAERVMDMAKDVRENSSDTEMVFLSKDSSHAIEAFRLGARHYILLPAGETEIMEAMDRCLLAMETNWQRRIVLKTSEGWQQATLREMESVISDDHCQTLQMTDGRLLHLRMGLRDLAERLEDVSPVRFLSPARGALVNAEEIEAFTGDSIIMKSGRTFTVSKRRIAEMKRILGIGGQ